MENVGAICEGEWNSSFNGMCSEEADFMAQLLGNCSLPAAAVSCFWAGNESNGKNLEVEESSMYSSQEMDTSSSMFSFSLGHTNIFPSYIPMDYSTIDGKNNVNVMEGDDFLNQDDSIESDHKQSFKKRPRIPAQSQRSKRFKKCDENDDSNNNATATTTNVVLHRQSSSNCCSEDDSNEANGMNSSSSSRRSGAQNLSGKTRASRGSATDPQSLYARKRRERINERLKVLQSLVPNGTKVDISTMLEEAVQYVKFLQLQIKLLSSEDMWMYAPIAYNGMDLGLDLMIPSIQPQS